LEKVKRLGTLLVLTLLVVCSLGLDAQTEGKDYRIRKVVIDAGHGGKDPGAIGTTGYHEKTVALNVALLVGKYIQENLPDVEVIYTRSTDVFIELHERARIANDANADFFISIHANAAANSAAYGTETWVLGTNRNAANLEVLKRENAVIELEDNPEENYIDLSSPEAQIMIAQRQAANLDESIAFARNVEDQFQFRVKRKSRGIKQGGLYVIYKTKMPSALIELGFLSNPEEEAYLKSEDGQVYLASAIYRAFKDLKLDHDAKAGVYANAVNDNPTVGEEVSPVLEEIPVGDEVVFRIQLMASSKQLKEKSFKGLEEIFEEAGDGLYRYFSGNYADYQEALAGLPNVKSTGFDDAFVVAFRNGQKVPVTEALSMSNK
jgi:N-acetylmuramoyl-L-alanine amidase